MKAVKVCTDGTVTGIDLQEPIYQSITEQIGGIEIVRDGSWPGGIVMVVDDCGLLKKLPHNIVGSFLYGNQIVGDAILICEGMTDEGPDFVDMDQDLYEETIDVMTSIYQGVSEENKPGHEVRGEYEIAKADMEKSMDPQDLKQLLEMSGAQVVEISSMDELPEVLKTIIEERENHVSNKTGSRSSNTPIGDRKRTLN